MYKDFPGFCVALCGSKIFSFVCILWIDIAPSQEILGIILGNKVLWKIKLSKNVLKMWKWDYSGLLMALLLLTFYFFVSLPWRLDNPYYHIVHYCNIFYCFIMRKCGGEWNLFLHVDSNKQKKVTALHKRNSTNAKKAFQLAWDFSNRIPAIWPFLNC